MSYDVWLEIDTGGSEPVRIGEDLNHTYNCYQMFRLALGGDGINDLHGVLAGDALPKLEASVRHIFATENAEEYRAMNPKNGWGSHDTAKAFLEALAAEARRHPKATFRVG